MKIFETNPFGGGGVVGIHLVYIIWVVIVPACASADTNTVLSKCIHKLFPDRNDTQEAKTWRILCIEINKERTYALINISVPSDF